MQEKGEKERDSSYTRLGERVLGRRGEGGEGRKRDRGRRERREKAKLDRWREGSREGQGSLRGGGRPLLKDGMRNAKQKKLDGRV